MAANQQPTSSTLGLINTNNENECDTNNTIPPVEREEEEEVVTESSENAIKSGESVERVVVEDRSLLAESQQRLKKQKNHTIQQHSHPSGSTPSIAIMPISSSKKHNSLPPPLIIIISILP